MRKEIFETKEHTVIDRVLVDTIVTCDVCGEQIQKNKGYWTSHTWHHDWGNDSCESDEYFDLCSPQCLLKHAEEYSAYSNSRYNTEEIHIEHKYLR